MLLTARADANGEGFPGALGLGTDGLRYTPEAIAVFELSMGPILRLLLLLLDDLLELFDFGLKPS